METSEFQGWLEEHLVCPRDHNRLSHLENKLVCPLGHTYPIVDGIPVMLLEDETSTQPEIFNTTLERVKSYRLSQMPNHKQDSFQLDSHSVDPFVQQVISAVCGRMFKSLINKLSQYPIPELPLPKGQGRYFLDVGCNWGRWCISAAGLGYRPIGIDHNLDAIEAAYRVSRQLGISAYYLVADTRYLPFAKNSFDTAFSYSILQHFDKEVVKICLAEISRTLKHSGTCLAQMPNTLGLVNLYHQFKRAFEEPEHFEVRYWRPTELIKIFTNFIGSTTLFVDGFFSLDAQYIYKNILPFRYRIVIDCSERLKQLSKKIHWFKYCADSLFVKSSKR